VAKQPPKLFTLGEVRGDVYFFRSQMRDP
jgi:hypothetical protein